MMGNVLWCNALNDIIIMLFIFLFCCLDESSVGLLYSPLAERNVGKTLTQDLLGTAQGFGRGHPFFLSGGDQGHSGTSV